MKKLLTFVSAMILLLNYSIVYSQNRSEGIRHEGFNSKDAPPTNWKVHYMYENSEGEYIKYIPHEHNKIKHSDYYTKEGERSFCFSSVFNNEVQTEVFLISDKISGYESDEAIQFFYKPHHIDESRTNEVALKPEKFQVGYSYYKDANLNDKDHWIWSKVITVAPNSDWQAYVDANIEDNLQYVCIRYLTKNGYSLYIDDFNIISTSPMILESIDISQENNELVRQGQENVEMAKLNIKTNNFGKALELETIKIQVNNRTNNIALKPSETIKNIKVFYTGSSDQFNTEQLIGNAVNTTNKYAYVYNTYKTGVTLGKGDNYFWITYDVNDNVENDTKLDVKITNITIPNSCNEDDNDDNDIDYETNPQGYRIVRSGFGKEVIRIPEDYTSLELALEDIQYYGFNDELNIELSNSYFLTQLTIENLKGISSSKKIKIYSEGKKARLYCNNGSEDKYGVLTLNKCENILFENIEFYNSNDKFPQEIIFKGENDYIIFRNCTFLGKEDPNLNIIDKTAASIQAIPEESSSEESLLSNLFLENCTFTGGPIAIKIANNARSILLNKCVLTEQLYSSIEINKTHGFSIQDCEIKNSKLEGLVYSGLKLNDCLGPIIIRRNKIRNGDVLNKRWKAIELLNIKANNEYIKVFNNAISCTNKNTTAYGIYSNNVDSLKIFHNTISFDGSNSEESSCMHMRSAIENSQIYNNIFYNISDGYALYLKKNSTNFFCDNNYYIVPTSGNRGTSIFKIGNPKYNDLNEWKDATNLDLNSYHAASFSFQNGDKYYKPTDNNFNVVNMAKDLNEISLDIEGEKRRDSKTSAGCIQVDIVPSFTTIEYAYENANSEIVDIPITDVTMDWGIARKDDVINREFHIKNEGKNPFTLKSINLPDNMEFTDPDIKIADVTIHPRESMKIDLTFNAEEIKKYNDNINIKYLVNTETDIAVKCNVIPQPYPILKIMYSDINYTDKEKIVLEKSKPLDKHIITLANIGEKELKYTKLNITGGSFSITRNDETVPSGTILSGEEVDIEISCVNPIDGIFKGDFKLDMEGKTVVYKIESAYITGINEIANSDIKIYPIPSDGKINILSKESVGRIIIKSINGQIIKSNDIVGNSTSLELDKGFYILTIENKKNVIQRKLIIQ
ncbi:MAG: BNR-repeat neuraminidase N-terminal domain-containing protein [Hyphomicrobiales bacterium]